MPIIFWLVASKFFISIRIIKVIPCINNKINHFFFRHLFNLLGHQIKLIIIFESIITNSKPAQPTSRLEDLRRRIPLFSFTVKAGLTLSFHPIASTVGNWRIYLVCEIWWLSLIAYSCGVLLLFLIDHLKPVFIFGLLFQYSFIIITTVSIWFLLSRIIPPLLLVSWFTSCFLLVEDVAPDMTKGFSCLIWLCSFSW